VLTKLAVAVKLVVKLVVKQVGVCVEAEQVAGGHREPAEVLLKLED
jgi:hypothetical protein